MVLVAVGGAVIFNGSDVSDDHSTPPVSLRCALNTRKVNSAHSHLYISPSDHVCSPGNPGLLLHQDPQAGHPEGLPGLLHPGGEEPEAELRAPGLQQQ